jgi:hypothetical protein
MLKDRQEGGENISKFLINRTLHYPVLSTMKKGKQIESYVENLLHLLAKQNYPEALKQYF